MYLTLRYSTPTSTPRLLGPWKAIMIGKRLVHQWVGNHTTTLGVARACLRHVRACLSFFGFGADDVCLLCRRLYEAICRDYAVKLYLEGFSIQLVAIDPVTAVGTALLQSRERSCEERSSQRQIPAVDPVAKVTTDRHHVAECYAGNLYHRPRNHTVGRPALASGDQLRTL